MKIRLLVINEKWCDGKDNLVQGSYNHFQGSLEGLDFIEYKYLYFDEL